MSLIQMSTPVRSSRGLETKPQGAPAPIQSNTPQNNSNINQHGTSTTPILTLIQQQPYLAEAQGDHIKLKQSTTIRIGLININGVTQTNSNPKNQHIKSTIDLYAFDHVALIETNCNWTHMEEEHRWHERTKTWWKKSKSVVAHNITDISTTVKQPGGVIGLTTSQATSCVIDSGIDPKLGRWSWTTLKGKNNVRTTIITGYRPCRNMKDENSTYNQQLRYLNKCQIDKCPRELWLEEMKELIQRKIQQQHQIILLADLNENVKGVHISNWAKEVGIVEVVSQTTPLTVPSTQKGSTPIDGIFLSHSLTRQQAGYFPFGIFQSDHRALWIDIDEAKIFGFKVPNDNPTILRRLQCQVPSVREAWKRHYKNFLVQHKLVSRQLRLEEEIQQLGMMTENLAKQYEKILQQRKEGMAYADKRCRPLFFGKIPYSPDFAKASDTIELWRAAGTIKRGCRYSSRLFRRLEKKLGLAKCLHKSIQEIKEEEDKAWKEYWGIKKKALALRKSFLEQKAEAIAGESDTQSASNVYKQLITREQQRKDSKQIKATLKKLNKLSVSMVEVNAPDGTIMELVERQQLELACVQENHKKYDQTKETICMQEPFRSLLGTTGNTEFCNAVLSGTHVLPQHTPPYTAELFTQLKRHPMIQDTAVHGGVTSADFQNGWNIMKECTSSASLTGLHFGHLKACATDATLTAFESSVAHIPFFTGYSPHQWQESVIVMIKKKINRNHISALRSVVLTEADFNFNNKLLGRRTIQHAEELEAIAPEQYGSRKHKSAITQALHKRVTYDIIRQTKTPGALCSNDAKSCYDRVLHSIVGLAYRRLGIPHPPVQCMLESIQNMKHFIKTGYGISTIAASKRNTLIPYQGILQGNGAAPTTWVIISTPLLNMLRAAGNGAKFVSPMSLENTHLVGFAFVDDTDLISLNMDDDEVTWENIGQDMQDAINRWEGGLKSTGGAIVPEKSWVFPLEFKFDEKGGATYKTPAEINQQFLVLDQHDTRTNLNTLAADVGKETLGVTLAPDGNNDDAYESLLIKVKEWRDNIRAGHLSPELAWQATVTTIMKSVEYQLPVLTLTEKQCNKLMGILKSGLLPCAKLSKSLPHAALYGSINEGGLNIHHFYITQGLMHIEKFVQYIATDSITGRLLRVSVEAAQLEVGIGRDLFSLDFDQCGHLMTETWIKNLWQFSHEFHIKVINRTINLPLPQREGDVFLMEAFIEQGYTNTQLQILNRCRLYLGVMLLSEVMTGSGDSFTEHYLCQREPQPRNRYNWPRQPYPTLAMRKLWKKALKKTFGLRAGKTSYKIGRWLHNVNDTWPWFYNPRQQNLFQQTSTGWKLWRRAATRGAIGPNSKFKYCSNCIAPPRNCEKATVRIHNRDRVVLTGYASCLEDSQLTYNSAIQPKNVNLRIIHNDLNIENFRQALQTGGILAVSDGSFYPQERVGAAAWVLEETIGGTSIIGSMPAVGDSSIQNPCRSELMGLYYILLHLYSLCKEHNITSGKVTLYCDGLSAIQLLQSCHKDMLNTKKHFDITNAIIKMLQEIPLTVNFKHIKGHQDLGSAYHNLSRLAQLNVQVDDYAKQEAQKTIQFQHDYSKESLPFSPCDIFLTTRYSSTIKVNDNLIETIRSHITGETLRDYWIHKHKLNGCHKNIDWELRKKSTKNAPRHRQRWLCKFSTGFCGVGKMLYRYKWQNHTQCPRCQMENETTTHVLQCNGQGTKNLWQKELASLNTWMIKYDIHSELRHSIIEYMDAWVHQDTPRYTPSNHILKQAIREQEKIGWYEFFLGFWSQQFHKCQTEHFATRKSPKSAQLLLSRLQRRIWQIAWNIWDHRNKFLHEENNSYHPTEINAINKEIEHEWVRHVDNLPPQYSTLFSGTLDDKQKKTHTAKLRWLTTIWALRETHNPDYFLTCTHEIEPMTRYRYMRWKELN